MVELNAVRSPVCTTTLIVSLGPFSTPQSIVTVVVNVVVPVGAYQVADAMLTEMHGDDPADMGVRG